MTLRFSRKFKALRRSFTGATLTGTVAIAAMSYPLAAQQQDWWCDVEVIVFERLHDTPLDEQFESLSDTPNRYTYDLLGDALYPDINSVLRVLPLCPIDELPSIETLIAEYHAFLDAEQANQENNEGVDELETELTIPKDQLPPVLPRALDPDVQASIEVPSQEGPDASDLVGEVDAFEELAQIDADELAVKPSPLTQLIAAQQTYIDQLDPVANVQWQRSYDCLAPEDVLTTDHFVFLNNIDILPRADKLPRSPVGANWLRNYEPHLLDADQHLLKEFTEDIQRQRNQRVLLHTTWRQEVLFGRDVAQSMRLIAGQDYNATLYKRWEKAQATALLEEQFANEQAELVGTLNPKDELEDQVQSAEEPLEDPFFTELFEAINGPVDPEIVTEILEEQNSAIDEAVHLMTSLWQLDGEFKVFLQYIGGVPYLHIDNDLRFKRPTQYNQYGEPTAFDNIEMKQLRRVISQQSHYFDHPLFGVIVQIRRYQRPTLLDDELVEGVE